MYMSCYSNYHSNILVRSKKHRTSSHVYWICFYEAGCLVLHILTKTRTASTGRRFSQYDSFLNLWSCSSNVYKPLWASVRRAPRRRERPRRRRGPGGGRRASSSFGRSVLRCNDAEFCNQIFMLLDFSQDLCKIYTIYELLHRNSISKNTCKEMKLSCKDRCRYSRR